LRQEILHLYVLGPPSQARTQSNLRSRTRHSTRSFHKAALRCSLYSGRIRTKQGWPLHQATNYRVLPQRMS
jgi:hypothetical protein